MATKTRAHKPQIRLTKDANPIDTGLRFGSQEESDKAAAAFIQALAGDDAVADNSIGCDDEVNATYPPASKTKTAR